MNITALIDTQHAEPHSVALDWRWRRVHGAIYCGALLGAFWFATVAVGSGWAFSPENTGLQVASGQMLAQDDPASAGVRDEWQTLVEDLQAPEFARRESASKKLGGTEFAAMVQVLPLLTSDDAELAWRAKEVMIQQGIRGSGEVVRRIGLVLRLLTAAGHQQFAEDAEKFESRIAAIRVLEATRRLEASPDISVIPGPQFRGMMVGGNVFRIQRGIVVGQAQIEIGPRFILPNAAPVKLLEVPDLLPNRQIDQAAPGLPDQAVPTEKVTDPRKSPEIEIAADEQIRGAHLKANLKNWLEQCVTSDLEALAALEQAWQDMGLIGSSSTGPEQEVSQYFEITISRTIGDEQVAALRNFFHNPVSVILAMNDVDMSPGLQQLVVESVEAGKIQYLNTYKCGYNMETCNALGKLLKEGRLGQWQTQGRAMLGIRTDSLLLGRSDTAERGGALVGLVTEDSAAAIAGIQPGDLIRKINDIPVENFEELRRIVAAFDVGDTIHVELVRNNARLELDVTLMQHTQ